MNYMELLCKTFKTKKMIEYIKIIDYNKLI